MSETTSILGGVRVIESKWLPAESRWKIFADWRARLARNLSRRSTARWEPLDDGQTFIEAYLEIVEERALGLVEHVGSAR